MTRIVVDSLIKVILRKIRLCICGSSEYRYSKRSITAAFAFITSVNNVHPQQSPRAYAFSDTLAIDFSKVSEVDKKFCFLHTNNGQKSILLFAGDIRRGFGAFKSSLTGMHFASESSSATGPLQSVPSQTAATTKIIAEEFPTIASAIKFAVRECEKNGHKLEVLAIVRSQNAEEGKLELLRYRWDEAKEEAIGEKKEPNEVVHVGKGAEDVRDAFTFLSWPVLRRIKPSHHLGKSHEDIVRRGLGAMKKVALKDVDVGGACTISTLNLNGDFSHQVVPIIPFDNVDEWKQKRAQYKAKGYKLHQELNAETIKQLDFDFGRLDKGYMSNVY